MTKEPPCPKCNSEFTYSDQGLWICPSCSHEWSQSGTPNTEVEPALDNTIRDANGLELKDGDTVTVIKELKIKGSSSSVKVGTKVKNIRLDPDGSNGHNISCKIDGLGAMSLKSEFVRKA